MKGLLLSVIEFYAKTKYGDSYDTWNNGRFIETWAETWIIDRLNYCFAQYNNASIISALTATMDLFRLLAVEISEKRNYQYPKNADEYTCKVVAEMLFNYI